MHVSGSTLPTQNLTAIPKASEKEPPKWMISSLSWVTKTESAFKQSYSDGFDASQWLWYPLGRHKISKGKAQTYSVEADNAELRHDLARIARKSRCFLEAFTLLNAH